MSKFRVMLAFVLAIGWLVVGPSSAEACACGAMITTEQAVVQGETAVVRYANGTETIDMKMTLGKAAKDAAWIMPVPQGTRVSLGMDAQFERLFELTRPKEKKTYDFNPLSVFRLGGEGAGSPETGSPPVRVDSVAVIGPFEVTTLSASDPHALSDWLVGHGYTSRPDLEPTLASYVERGWQTLAVKLTPEGGTSLGGDLDPLRMVFDTDEVVYPIMLSRHARAKQDVRLYLLADHRMEVATEAAPKTPLKVRFAGPLGITDIDPSLSGESTIYVTAFTAQLNPERIVDDYRFRQAPTDEPVQEYYTTTVQMGHWTLLAISIAVMGLIGLAVARSVSRRSTTEG